MMKKHVILLWLLWSLMVAGSSAQIEGFNEPFDWVGSYRSDDGVFGGLHDPGWLIIASTANETGVVMEAKPPITAEERDPDFVRFNSADRAVNTVGGFIERVEFTDVHLMSVAEFQGPPGTASGIDLLHFRNHETRSGGLFLRVLESLDGDPSVWSLVSSDQENLTGYEVPAGQSIAFEIHYDYWQGSVFYIYDNNTSDDIERPYQLGPYENDAPFSDSQPTAVIVRAAGWAEAEAVLDHWSLTPFMDPSVPDFDGDGTLNVSDLELLQSVVRTDQNPRRYDLNVDRIVDEDDVRYWVHEIRDTYFGDANLDGEFNSRDLVEIFVAGEFEDQLELNSTWSTGDWSGSGEFDSSDLVLAFQDGGYEQGPRTAAFVPEPNMPFPVLLV
ncbi:MAG: hypothetical protein KDA87_27125, partial [Planctomycetales bacterium]|nr:hypothetical protein [Planctomycetales bacterium]